MSASKLSESSPSNRKQSVMLSMGRRSASGYIVGSKKIKIKKSSPE